MSIPPSQPTGNPWIEYMRLKANKIAYLLKQVDDFVVQEPIMGGFDDEEDGPFFEISFIYKDMCQWVTIYPDENFFTIQKKYGKMENKSYGDSNPYIFFANIIMDIYE
jgi:hypothetical protein